MKRQDVIDIIAGHKDDLRRMGVSSLELFGSVVRDEATDKSDVDFLVEFDRSIGLFELVEVQLYLEEILGVKKVDLVTRDCIYDEFKSDIYREALRVA